MKEHHQAYAALCLTAGEFVGSFYLLVHEGHFLALYLAFTYAMRETSGGKHYHDIVLRWYDKIKRDKACAIACEAKQDANNLPTLANPFGRKRRAKV